MPPVDRRSVVLAAFLAISCPPMSFPALAADPAPQPWTTNTSAAPFGAGESVTGGVQTPADAQLGVNLYRPNTVQPTSSAETPGLTPLAPASDQAKVGADLTLGDLPELLPWDQIKMKAGLDNGQGSGDVGATLSRTWSLGGLNLSASQEASILRSTNGSGQPGKLNFGQNVGIGLPETGTELGISNPGADNRFFSDGVQATQSLGGPLRLRVEVDKLGAEPQTKVTTDFKIGF